MKLSYFQLLSNDPINIGIGHIKIPTVRDRREIGEFEWWKYAIYSGMTIDNYFEAFLPDKYEEFLATPYEQRIKVEIYDLLDLASAQVYVDMFNFFFEEHVVFDIPTKEFRLFKYISIKNEETDETEDKKILVGRITRKSFQIVLDIIFQITNMNKEKSLDEELSKMNEEKDASMILFLKKRKDAKRKRQPKHVKQDPKYDIGNILSIVSAYGDNGLNCLNIDDVTIPQLYDQFTRIIMDRSYQLGARNVSVWGDKDKQFDTSSYMININEEN